MEGADKLAEDAKAEGSLGCISHILTAANVSHSAAGQAHVALEWFECFYLAELSWLCLQGQKCLISEYLALLHWTVALWLASLFKTEDSKQYCH